MATQIFLGNPPENIKQFIIDNYGPKEDPMLKTPLHFVAEEPGATISFSIGYGTYETSPTGEEGSWTPYKSKTIITLSNVGDKVYFRAGSDKGNERCESQFNIGKNDCKGKIAAKGNIQSLLDRKIERMHVPYNCYAFMFSGCTSLTRAPALPATVLANYCYYYMFYNCSSLAYAPGLPATTLADYCYGSMFEGCSSITKPEFKMFNLTFDEVVDAIQNNYIISIDNPQYESEPTFTYEIQCSDKTMIATPMYVYLEDYGYHVHGWTLEEKK